MNVEEGAHILAAGIMYGLSGRLENSHGNHKSFLYFLYDFIWSI
jgi:hypothetical protein